MVESFYDIYTSIYQLFLASAPSHVGKWIEAEMGGLLSDENLTAIQS
jgi:hypothetical protein